MARKQHEWHGETTQEGFRTPEYTAWIQVIQRCTNSCAAGYARYGGRGISVCERWRSSFGSFLADMGRKPSPEHSIERKNNDGNYEPGNCVWATRKVQARNKSSNHNISALGRTQCVADWAAELGCAPSAIARRLEGGWTPEDAVTTPPRECEERTIEARGQTLNLAQWSRLSGVSPMTIAHRLDTGGPPESAIFDAPGSRGIGRKVTSLLTIGGVTKPLGAWSTEFGIGRTTIENRLKQGWSHEDAVTKPVAVVCLQLCAIMDGSDNLYWMTA